MEINCLVRTALVTSLVWTGVCAGSASAQDPKDLALAIQEVKQINADLAKPGADQNAILSEQLIDIHGSGWRYNKAEHIELGRNLASLPDVYKPIKTERTEPEFVAYSRDMVVETVVSTTYYEVPNPQEVARAAGTMTDDPAALARARANQSHLLVPGPGEGQVPNPYRSRSTKVWVRVNGHWQVALLTGTRIGLKVIPGKY